MSVWPLVVPNSEQELAESLFEHALSLPIDAQATFVAEACGDDPALATELLSLLQHADAGRELFDRLATLLIAPPPFRAGRFEIVDCIAVGGMGAVYRARDPQLARDVALKFLPFQSGADRAAEASLLQEARAAAALEHPNICTVYEIGETENGRPFIAMALYEGETLKERLARGALSERAAVDIALQVTRGLAAAHARGIVHCDVKPGNIMLTADGTVKLLDFGIASTAHDTRTSHAAAGTMPYMSPEQVRREILGPRSDLWSLGVVLYEMLTGMRPFAGDDYAAIAASIEHSEPQPVRTLAPNASVAVQRIVERLLEKAAGQRYADAEALLADLTRIAKGPTRSRRALVLGGIGLLVLTLGAGAVSLRVDREARSADRSWKSAHPEAIAWYRKGRYFWDQRTRNGYALAIGYFQRSIAADSTFAPAYAGLAEAYSQQGMSGQLTAAQAAARARGLALRALALDDKLAEAHAVLGSYLNAYEWNSRGAEREFRRAIQLNPSYAMGHHYYGNFLRSLGRLDEAIRQNTRAVQLEPSIPGFSETLAFTLLRAGQTASALQQIHSALELDSTYWRAHAVLGMVYEQMHRYPAAIQEYERANLLAGLSTQRATAEIARVQALNGQPAEARKLIDTLRAEAARTGAYEPNVASALYALGDAAGAFAWLEQSYRQRHPDLRFINGDPRFLPLQREPRFQELMRRVGVR